MARVKPLSDNQIKALKPRDKEYKVADGDGLYIHIKPIGSKLWRYRYTLDGKLSTKAIGKYPQTSLKEARSKRDEYAKMVSSGTKPQDTIETPENQVVFSDLITKYYAHRDDLSDQYVMDCTNLLNRDFKSILKKSIDDITITDMIDCFKGMEQRGIKSATKKAGSLLNRLFMYAVTMQYTTNNPMASIDLTVLLKKHTPKNFAHITDEKLFKELLLAIDEYYGDIYTKAALRFMPYVFLRPANIRGMLWDEVDLDKKMWVIPADKMKMNRDHIVPLTDSMIQILESVNDGRSKYVFPSPQSPFRQLSENTLNVALKRLGFKDIMTSHGFRHTASTFLHENMHKHGISSEVIEMQLAHVEKNSIKGVYNKALYLEERVKLMQWWTDFLDAMKR